MKHNNTDGLIRIAVLALTLFAGSALAGEPVQAGRYLDHNTNVHDPAQVDPLKQVVDLKFGLNTQIRDALKLTLKGTGYQLSNIDSPLLANLMTSAVPRAQLQFDSKRVISIVRTLAGIGFNVEIRRAARKIVITPDVPPVAKATAPALAKKSNPVKRPTVCVFCDNER